MKINFLIRSLYKSGGIERVTCNLANLFIARGIDVSIITQDSDCASFYTLNNDVKLYSLHIDERASNESRWTYKMKIIKALRAHINQEQPDIVLAIWSDMSSYAVLAAIHTNTKVIACEHLAYEGLRLASRAEYYLRILIYPFADAIVALTKRDTNRYKRMNKYAHTIPNFVDLPMCEQDVQKENVVLAVGHITYRKGFDMLIEAWKQVHDIVPNWKLKIIGAKGEPEYGQMLQSRIEELGLTNNIQILKETKNITMEYQKASIFVMSSRQEGLPMVMLEAMLMGLPVVSFDCPTGPREIIADGENGYLVENGDINELSQKLVMLIEDGIKRERYAKSAIQHINEQFGKDNVFKMWQKIFDNTK